MNGDQKTLMEGLEAMSSDANLDYEVIIVGAGVAGIYQIKRLIDMGVKATVLEADPDLGGTWYNNRYPGARFDSESYTYGYSFSQEVLQVGTIPRHPTTQSAGFGIQM